MFQGATAEVFFIAFFVLVLCIMVYIVMRSFKGAKSLTNVFINFQLRTQTTIIKDYGKIGSVLLQGLFPQSVKLVKCSSKGEVFYVLVITRRFSRGFISVSKITLDVAQKLVAIFQGDTEATEGSGEQENGLSSMYGFPGKVVTNYGKIGVNVGLLKLDNNGEIYYLLTPIIGFGSQGTDIIYISLDMVEKLITAFQNTN